MAGHSHSANIAVRKNAQDKARGKLFTKLMREVYVAVKLNGADPDSNPRLRAAMAKARANSVPKDNIQRAIKKGSGNMDGKVYEELTMEGYGPGGVAVMARCLTDNRNRTAGDVRFAFSKHGGNLGTIGCVGYMFQKKGIIEVISDDEDSVMMIALDAGAEDIEEVQGGFRVVCEPDNFEECLNALTENEFELGLSDIKMVPNITTKITPEEQIKFDKMIERLEDCDDVQQVDHNLERQ